MARQETSPIHADRDRFLRQVVAHHRQGDFYPDPWAVSRELEFTFGQTEAVLSDLNAHGWIAASPYGPERLRLTPRCWNLLRRSSNPPSAVRYPVNPQSDRSPWHSADGSTAMHVSGQFPQLAALTDSQLVSNST